jgi:hypothetical protein
MGKFLRIVRGFVGITGLILLVVLMTAILRWRENSISINSMNLNIESTAYPSIDELISSYPLPEETFTPSYPIQRTRREIIGPDCLRDNSKNITMKLKKGWYGYISRTEVASIDIFNYDTDEIKYSHGKPMNLPDDDIKIEIYSLKIDKGGSLENWISTHVEKVNKQAYPEINLNASASEYYPIQLGKYSGYAYAVTDAGGWNARVIGLQLDQEKALVINLFPADSPAFSEALEILSTLNTSNNCSVNSYLPVGKKPEIPEVLNEIKPDLDQEFECPYGAGHSFSGIEAYNSTIPLQMPFMARES